MKKLIVKKVVIIMFVLIAITNIISCGSRSREYVIELDPEYNVSTDELLKNFL